MLQLRALFHANFVNRFFTLITCVTVFAVVLRYCFFGPCSSPMRSARVPLAPQVLLFRAVPVVSRDDTTAPTPSELIADLRSRLDARDPSKCGALMNEGDWLDLAGENDTTHLPHEWQPPGCMLHNYKPADVATCFANRRVVFAGDSTIRQLFWGVAKKLDKDVDTSQAEKHADITVEKNGVKLEFLWDPFLNSSRVKQEQELFEGDKYPGQDPNRPSILLMGTGLWYARFETLNGMKKWKDNIDEAVSRMRLGRKTTDLTRQDLIMLTPVTIPVWGRLNEERKKTITAQTIMEMNTYLQQLSDIHGLDVMWAFESMTYGLPQTYESSGLHLNESIVAKQAEVLLNLRCNAVLPSQYPYDKTCCNMYEAPNHQQWLGLVFVLAILPAMSYFRNKAEARGVKPASWLPSEKVANALLVFGLAIVYCFYADRTQVFNKFHKHYTTFSFSVLTFMWLFIGYLSVGRTSKTAADQPFLSRHQTDEWKGWLQFAILVYHYTGASKIAWIYGFIRVTVAAYLFMTGYGHTVYFYKKADYSLKRVAAVLIRLNLLSCVLPYMMKTEYIFYYFAPLVTFWFFVVYFTMRIGSQHNGNSRFLISKIAVSAIIITTVTKFPGILEALFEIPHVLAATQWNVAEFRFRLFLDMWIVYVGMLTALAVVKLNDSNSSYSPSFQIMRKYALAASAIALPLFIFFQMTRETKFIYNAYHPYISWIPILSYITLRNATPLLRNAHSGVFAWLGKCSLETFTLQFHIWMAADTHGILDLSLFGPYSRVPNFILTTVVFLFTSHCVAGATQDLTNWILGVKEKPQTTLPVARDQSAVKQDEIRLRELGADVAAASGGENEGASEGWATLKVKCGLMMLGLWVLNFVSASSSLHWVNKFADDRLQTYTP
jgi:hypothetical protein